MDLSVPERRRAVKRMEREDVLLRLLLVVEMEGDRLLEVGDDLIERASLCDDGDVEAFSDVAGLIPRADHRLDHRGRP
jgi:hypothetical protein